MPRDHHQGRALSRTTGAEERNKLSFANVEANFPNRLDGLKVLGDVGKFNHGAPPGCRALVDSIH